MVLEQWALRWNVPFHAIEELKKHLGVQNSIEISNSKSEAAIQNIVRLEATKKGCRLWRNNVGATYTREGSFIRFGLANESTAVNKKIKSADLIGIKPIKITHDLVGKTIGQFLSREIKSANWKYSGNEREVAQLQWAELIISLGGDAGFATSEGTI